MEVNHLPTVLPMWISGFNDIMPEPRGFPRFIPRPGAHLTVSFGKPIEHANIRSMLALQASPADTVGTGTVRSGVDPDAVLEKTTTFGASGETEAKRAARCALTDLLQREVEALGYGVSDPLLGKKINEGSR